MFRAKMHDEDDDELPRYEEEGEEGLEHPSDGSVEEVEEIVIEGEPGEDEEETEDVPAPAAKKPASAPKAKKSKKAAPKKKAKSNAKKKKLVKKAAAKKSSKKKGGKRKKRWRRLLEIPVTAQGQDCAALSCADRRGPGHFYYGRAQRRLLSVRDARCLDSACSGSFRSLAVLSDPFWHQSRSPYLAVLLFQFGTVM